MKFLQWPKYFLVFGLSWNKEKAQILNIHVQENPIYKSERCKILAKGKQINVQVTVVEA